MSKLIQAVRGLHPVLRVRTVRGEPITVGERQLVPLARSISFTVGRPGGPLAAGYTRIRPVAVLETWRGRTRRIPIPDMTRRIALALMAFGFLLTLTARSLRRRREKCKRSVEL